MKMRSPTKKLSDIRNTIISTIVVSFIVQGIPPISARNDGTTYTTILNGNHTEFLYWTLDNTDDKHILNCTLAEDVEPDIFEWTFEDGAEINSTDVIFINDTSRSILLNFVNITYDVADIFLCRSIKWDANENKTFANITTVSIFVNESKKLELLIGMSAAAVAFFVISLIVIKIVKII